MRNAAVFLMLAILATAKEEIDHRLPKNVIPYYYTIELDIESNFLFFDGKTEIDVEVIEETDRIILHAANLRNLEARVFFYSIECRIINKTFQKNFQYFIMDFEQKLQVGKYVIEMTYRANFNTGTTGFYLTSYTIYNKKRYRGIG